MRPYIKVGICRRHWEMGTRAAVERRARPEQLAPEPGSAPRARDVLNTLSYAIDSLYRTLGFGTSMVCVGILPVVLRVYQGCADVHGNARALPCRHHLPPCPPKRRRRRRRRRRRVLECSVREHDHAQWEGPDVMMALVWNNLKE